MASGRTDHSYLVCESQQQGILGKSKRDRFRLVLEDTGRKDCLSHGSPATTAIFDEKTDEENVQEVDQHPLLLWL